MAHLKFKNLGPFVTPDLKLTASRTPNANCPPPHSKSEKKSEPKYNTVHQGHFVRIVSTCQYRVKFKKMPHNIKQKCIKLSMHFITKFQYVLVPVYLCQRWCLVSELHSLGHWIHWFILVSRNSNYCYKLEFAMGFTNAVLFVHTDPQNSSKWTALTVLHGIYKYCIPS